MAARRNSRKCSKCHTNRALRFYSTPRARVCADCKRGTRRRLSREQHLSETYGITLAEYDEILRSQKGACAICGRVYKGRRNLEVDHDHEAVRQGATMRQSIRGLLCRLCNGRLLPAAGDDPKVLEKAIQYLCSPRWFA